MSGTQFEGTTAQMKPPSPWLTVEDMQAVGRDEVEVVISGVYQHKGVKFEDGRTKDVYTLAFEGKSKQMIINTTNRITLRDKFGTNVKEWKGKSVVLYIDWDVKMAGKKVGGIRVKAN